MQLIDKDKCLKQIMDITEDIEHSNSNIKFIFKKNKTILNLFERTNQSNPAKVIPSEALHSPYNMQKTSKVLHSMPKISESDKQRRNIDRINKAKHLCRNISYDDDTAYNHDDFHV